MSWRLKENQNGSGELIHYGILGMKWGVRRSQEQLGHIKKGTKIYRVTPNPNEKEDGSTYVTYLRPDRDMYRGAFIKQGGFAKYYGIEPGTQMYESIYKAKEDLNVATFDVQKEVTNRVLKQNKEKLFKELCQHTAKERIDEFKKIKETYEEYRKSSPNQDPKAFDKTLRDYYMLGTKNDKEYVQKVVSDFKDMTPDELYRVASSRFGKERIIKESVISELKKQGYNAMIDQASVGGGGRNIEGQAPMIIFDRGNSLDKMSSNKISKLTTNVAATNYMDWYYKVNSSQKRKVNW